MFKSMKLSSKLSLGFAMLTLIAAIIGLFGMVQIKNIEDADTKMYEKMTLPLGHLVQMVENYQKMRVSLREVMMAEANGDKQKHIDKFYEQSTKYDSLAAIYQTSLIFEDGRKLFKEMESNKKEYVRMTQLIFNAWLNNDKLTALSIMYGDAQIPTKALDGSIDKMQTSKIGFAKQTSNENTVTANFASIVMIILIVLGILASATLAFFIIKGVLRQLGADPMDVQAIANKVAEGDLSSEITIKAGDTSSLIFSMDKMSKAVKAMVQEVKSLAQAGVEGKLDKRANASLYQGDYREVVQGLNATLDAVIGPLNMAAEYIDRISKGDIPHTITDNYNGDFNEIKMNLNQCMSAIRLLVDDTTLLAKAAEDGKLSVRADANKHQGDFRKVIQGINNTLELIIQPVEETVKVIKEMAEGNLAVRVSGNFKGDHAVLKDSLNETLDSLPLQETMSVMQEMADGNLTVRMNGTYKGDSLKLKNAVNDTIEALNEILSNVSTTVEEVTRAAMQVSDTSTALSQGATEQAASLEEITSSMGEIGSQTRLNAENSNLANTLAHEARDAAERGNREMTSLNDAMTEINESSKSISKIIKVIDEIAFQTNLLALNAAVEAARAGRHGKGFAVVAEEVRNLAARSATAAKETSELIENSIKTVDRGTELVSKTGDALSEIQSSSVKVTDIIGEITTSSNEQAQGISQINEGLTQIDKVTQTNTASAEESASAAEELSSQSSQLRDLVGKFRLSGNAGRISNSPRPKQLNRSGSGSRALPPSSSRRTPVREEDLYSMVDDSIRDSERLGHKPEDIIRLDEDDFGRY